MRLSEICYEKMAQRHLSDDKTYTKRLKWELEEIYAKEKESYFLDLYDRRVRYPFNQNNLLVPWLLGIVSDHFIEKTPNCVVSGDWPDIDLDYVPQVRSYLKEVWAPKEFGEEYVCNIANYTTFGIKSSLLDMARVHGESREEIQPITKDLEAKDDEGKSLTWDAAMRLYPELKKYCETHPEVATAAKRLLNRNRGTGIHAGGLIIASSPLHDLVPLIKRKDAPQASAWVEGLHGKDLQPVGLVKFDLLVISNLVQIAVCCELVKKRHGIEGICALPGQSDWTDVPKWRNDPVSLGLANNSDLKCIFQFDGEGIRNLVRAGGVDRFEDLVAYASLFQPGPLNCKMQERYVERKKGREEYPLHPLIKPVLEKNYGVMVYQEDVMKILNIVGNIPLKDCELVRKAISLKKLEGFVGYKEKFLENGRKNLNCTDKEINHLWDQIESFAEYGFNKTLTEDTIIDSTVGPKPIKDFIYGDKVYCINEQGERVETKVVALHNHGVMDVYEIEFDDGYKCKCTLDHKFLTEYGQVPLWKIINFNLSILCSPLGELNVKKTRLASFSFHAKIANTGGLVSRKILRIVPVGKQQCYDLEVACSTHNFLLPNGIVTSNSHAVAYTYISMYLLYLKAHFPNEFYTSILSSETLSEKIKEYKIEAKLHDVVVQTLDINKSGVNFELIDDQIYFGFSKVKGIGEAPAKRIVENQPYKSFEDFLQKFGTDASVLKPLIGLRCFKDRDPITLWKFAEHYKDCAKKIEDRKKRYLASMARYEEEFKSLLSNETRSLADVELQSEEWKKLYDIEEYKEVEKEVECEAGEGVPRHVITTHEVDEFTSIEIETLKYFKKIKVQKSWNRWEMIKKLFQKRKTTLDRHDRLQEGALPTLLGFNPNVHSIDNTLASDFVDPVKSEEKYYGFAWVHELEYSPDYHGYLTFDAARVDGGPVELQVKKVTKITSKKGNTYHQILAEDVTGQLNKINIWEDDWNWWSSEFAVNNLLRVRLQPPSNGFATFTLESNQVGKWRGQKRYQHKRDDIRVCTMLRGERKKEKFLTDEEALEQFSNCIMNGEK